jgi:hypothetical protein
MNEAVIIRNSRGALVFAFLAGATVGVFAGAALVRKAMQEQMTEQIEEEFARLQKKYTGGTVKPYANPTEAVEKLHPGLSKTNGFQAPVKQREHVAYEKIREFTPGDEAPDADVDPEEEQAIIAEYGESFVDDPTIYPITFEEFDANSGEHLQESLMYYPVDDVVADPQNRVVENYPSVLGRKFLEGLVQSTEPYDTHIRNLDLKIDYEVTVMPGQSFKRDVLNEDDDNLTDRQRINGA